MIRQRISHRHIVALFVAALLIRAAVAPLPLSYHPDQIFQYLEQAHRLAFGYGVTPWEYRYGIRSWLLPGLLSSPMALGEALLPGTAAYLLLPKLCLAVVSLAAVAGAWRLGRLVSDTHGLAAAVVAAFWSENIFFASQALTDAVAAPLFILGAAFIYGRHRHARLAVAGFLIAFAAVMRFQYAPAIGFFTLIVLWASPRRAVPMAVGGTAALLATGCVDLAFWDVPFGWIARNWQQNIGAGRAAGFGAEGPFFYPLKMLETWHLFAIPIAWLAWVGGRRYPALFWTALLNVAVHSFIAHKEYRFILLSVVVIVVLAAIGTVDVVRRARVRHPESRAAHIAIASWIAASVLVMVPHVKPWIHAAPGIRTFDTLRRSERLCGVAVLHGNWTQLGGYSYLHRDVPIAVFDLLPRPEAMLRAHWRGFDAIVAPPGDGGRLPPGYGRQACYGTWDFLGEPTLCVYRRSGGCTKRDDGIDFEAALRRHDR